MMSKRRYAIPAVLATLLVIAGAIFWGYASPGDLSLLAPYHAKFSYDKLIEQVNALPPDPASFTFVVLGDHRNNTHTAKMVFAKALEENPAIIFDTGDLIRDGSVAQYLDHHLPLVEMAAPVPVFCVPGNHERGDRRDFAGFEAIYGGSRFSFDYAGCRFVGFNAAEKLRVTGGDLAFVDQELSKPGSEHRFVFFHIPPDYFENTIIGDDTTRGFSWNAGELRKILSEHQVTEVFMGHIHGHATAVIDGVRYSLTAGAGAPAERATQRRPALLPLPRRPCAPRRPLARAGLPGPRYGPVGSPHRIRHARTHRDRPHALASRTLERDPSRC